MDSSAPREMLQPQDEASLAAQRQAQQQMQAQPGGEALGDTLPQTVRFASVNQEIEPSQSLQSTSQASDQGRPPMSPEAQDEIRNLSLGLHNSHIHQTRTSNFAFEPMSLPVSRVPSNESSPYYTSREATRSGATSPRISPPSSTMPTPPLTPAGTHRGQVPDGSGANLAKVHPDPVQMTPQIPGPRKDASPTSAATSRPTTPSDQAPTRPTSVSRGSNSAELPAKQALAFSLGPSESSGVPGQSESSEATSRETSPYHGEGGSGTVTPPGYSRPFTPAGDHNDPYARNKRPPQTRNLDSIDKRFVFGDARRRSGINFAGSSSGALPRSNSGSDLKAEHRKSTFSLHSMGGQKDHLAHLDEKPHGSMSELKRFFGIGGHHKSKRTQSPAKVAKAAANSSGTRTPPHPGNNIPFADDHGLQSKWGKFGKVLGSGAGGSVKLMKRSSDGLTFAVKQFRDRHSYETEREYNKKVTAEFCIGSTLHHGNIIETLDIIHERGHWYEVMEYAPFDLFAIVMTGKMSREEVACSFLQIVSGVTFLHSMGLAHRDLKLDNVVVNEHGIMKLIDFGSASVFRYPFENDIIMATGVVGSDPYLAPEVYDQARYDPQPTDVWSLAIIFACMSLRRFPWKAPRVTDNSYKLFISPPTPGTPYSETGVKERSKSAVEVEPSVADERRSSAPHEQHGEKTGNTEHAHEHNPGTRIDVPKADIIRGPWRLLRLLPRETRTIMGRMLQINPKHRATLEDMMADPWMMNTPVCQQVEGGKVIKAVGHEHTLEPGTTTTA